MSERDVYVEKTKAMLDQWNAEIDKTKAKIDEAAADSKIRYQKQLEVSVLIKLCFSPIFDPRGSACLPG